MKVVSIAYMETYIEKKNPLLIKFKNRFPLLEAVSQNFEVIHILIFC